jgi:hypothetical protein
MGASKKMFYLYVNIGQSIQTKNGIKISLDCPFNFIVAQGYSDSGLPNLLLLKTIQINELFYRTLVKNIT